ncbi:MAG TPA: PAS domain S-box protein [Thermodesulfobacteriota bacterium]|nr:PAS domain S-box protein [Thermodesulfobacteriota bacterium]
MGWTEIFRHCRKKSDLFNDGDGKFHKLTQVQKALQEIQSRYRKLLDHTQAIQYTHDLQGQFLTVDPEITEFLGYDRNFLLNINVRSILSPEVRDQFETYLEEIKRQGVSKGLMFVQTATGEKRILKYHSTLRTEAVANPFVQGIAYDVTEQKQTSKTLKQISEQLSIVLDSLPIVCYICKAEGGYGTSYITPNVKPITGFEASDFTSKASFWSDRIHPQDAPKILADLPRILEKGDHEHQYRWRVADGTYNWFYDYMRLIKSSDGKNHIVGMRQDITDRKRAEEALLNAAQQWRTTFDGIGDIVCLLDPEGKILRCNRALTEFLGKPFSMILNRPYWEIIHRTSLPLKESPVELMKETRRREIAILPIGDRWFNITVDPILDETCSLIGAVHTMSDITERRRSAEEVARLSKENAAVAEIGRIIGSTLNTEEVYERFSEEVHKLIPFDRSEIVMINTQDHTITIAHITGINVSGSGAGTTFSMTGTVAEEVFRTRSGQLTQSRNAEEFAKRFPRLRSSFQAGLRSMIFVPLISEDQVTGVLSLRTTKADAYTEKDLKLAERVGNQIAGAIANARLYTERKRAEESVARLSQENAIVAEIGRIVSSTLNIDEVYDRFAEEVRKLIPFDRISVSTINPGERPVTLAYVLGVEMKDQVRGTVLPLAGTLFEELDARRSAILIQREDEGDLGERYPVLLKAFQAGFRSMISAPLISNDELIGALHLRSLKPDAYKEADRKLAERVGNQIAGAIAKARLFLDRKQAEDALKRSEEEARRLSQENAIMAEIGRIVSSTLNIDEVYVRFVEEARKLIPFDGIAINIINREEGTVTVPYVSGLNVPGCEPGDALILEPSVTGKVAETRSGLVIPMEGKDELRTRFPTLIKAFEVGVRTVIVAPLISKDQAIGAIHFRSAKPNAYSEQDLNLAGRIADQIAGAVANTQLYAERKQMADALQKSEERFRDLYDHAPLGYHEYDADGHITSVNRTILEMLGYTAEEMIGKPMWSFNVEGDGIRRQVLGKLSGAAPPGRNLERVYRRKDGTTIPVLIEDRLILDEKGQIRGMRCTVQDITERKRAEEEKINLQEQLRQSQKMEAIGKLAGGVAHDFNNLLTVIHGYSELLLNSLEQDNEYRQDVQEIKRASERASSLTRQLLAFSRKQVLQPEVLDINLLVSNMDKMLRRMIGEDIELVTLLAKDLGRVKADPGQIEQVILNLAVNAKDAMRSGGKLTIETAAVTLDETYARSHIGITPGNYLMLSMSDTGVGMTPETKGRIFEPFFTTKDKGKGTGLGLSTVYGIIQQSGGSIWVYSEPGLGTTFKIYLPAIEGDAEFFRPAAVSTKLLQGSETVLLVEDEEMVRKLACAVLEKYGYRVLEASSGDSALAVAQGQDGNPIHLMVTDVVMPGMSGRQLADHLVSLRPDLKVLYMSGYTDNAIVHHGVLDPGISYIQKPFTPDALASKVREVLDGG